MKNIIDPIEKSLLKKELTHERFLRKTNNGNNDIYIITHNDSPNVMREIGRLREVSFSESGGGTGLDCDLDEFDTSKNPYKQLIVWDPKDREIVGGYRYIHGKDVEFYDNGQPKLSTSELFTFSQDFIENYLPNTIELGRSFVQPLYQPAFDFRKGMYSLDNLWDGLGALVIDTPDMKYYFGKVTMYPSFNIQARDLILYFMEKHFHDDKNLVIPHTSIKITTNLEKLKNILVGKNFKEDYKILAKGVRQLKEYIPPLFNAYINLSSTMKYFGTAINSHFGEVEESAILVATDDIYEMKKERHFNTYEKK
ncbi:MAG: GNAT family N-acetyltransferase [Bacteroidota bacterium]|nr:GNAT family N-acetyltransferase [Bacteroidota bacterium]